MLNQNYYLLPLPRQAEFLNTLKHQWFRIHGNRGQNENKNFFNPVVLHKYRKLPLVPILWRPIFWIKIRCYFLPEMGLWFWAVLLLHTHLLPSKSIPNSQHFPQVIYVSSFSSVPSSSPLDDSFSKQRKWQLSQFRSSSWWGKNKLQIYPVISS